MVSSVEETINIFMQEIAVLNAEQNGGCFANHAFKMRVLDIVLRSNPIFNW